MAPPGAGADAGRAHRDHSAQDSAALATASSGSGVGSSGAALEAAAAA